MITETTTRPNRPWEWVNPPKNPQPGVVHKTYYSDSMKHDVGYNIYLPPGYEASQKRYPVVYWLHGRNNCESTDFFPARFLEQGIRSGELPPTILVYPNGWWNSFYSDSHDGKIMSETTIIRELIPYVDHTYRTHPIREARAVQGMSMGGFGALKFAFKHTDLFSSVVAFAPALIEADRLVTGNSPSLNDIFGGDVSHFVENTPTTWVRKNAQQIRNRLPIWMICGTEDRLLVGVQKMHELLDELNIAHQLELVPGIAHNLPALSEAVQTRGFAFAAKAFRLPPE